MKEKPKFKYPVRTLRASDDHWEEFNNIRQTKDLSWNQYIKYLNELLTKKI